MTRRSPRSGAGVALLAMTAVLALAACHGPVPAGPGTASPAPTPRLSVPGTHTQVVTYQVTSPVSALIVTGHTGNITVTAGTGPAVSVAEQIAYSSTRPATRHTLTGGTLTLAYSCKLQLVCGVAYVITVPRTMAVRAATTTGAIRLSGLAGPAEASTDAGFISASALSSAAVSLRTGVGGINAAFAAPPATVSAATDAGSIKLSVPDTVSYQIRAHTYVGMITVTVPRSSSSARTITARTNVGTIVIAAA